MTDFYLLRFRAPQIQSINAIRPRFIPKTLQKKPEKHPKRAFRAADYFNQKLITCAFRSITCQWLVINRGY